MDYTQRAEILSNTLKTDIRNQIVAIKSSQHTHPKHIPHIDSFHAELWETQEMIGNKQFCTITGLSSFLMTR
jgi:hypothetical protein